MPETRILEQEAPIWQDLFINDDNARLVVGDSEVRDVAGHSWSRTKEPPADQEMVYADAVTGRFRAIVKESAMIGGKGICYLFWNSSMSGGDVIWSGALLETQTAGSGVGNAKRGING